MSDADYINSLARLTNSLAEAESLLRSLKQAAKGIVFCMKAKKTEFMFFNKKVPSRLGKHLKSEEQFTYHCSHISSTEKRYQHTHMEDVVFFETRPMI